MNYLLNLITSTFIDKAKSADKSKCVRAKGRMKESFRNVLTRYVSDTALFRW